MAHAHTDGHAHAHHFPNAQVQYDAAKLGMWVFLATELLLFGGLFSAYAVFKGLYPEMFAASNVHLNRIMGAVNTVILICSSYTAVLAVMAAKRGDNQKVQLHLWLTIAFAAAFGVVKYFEYSAKFEHHLYPSTNTYFGLYFVMTGIHMLHVAIGMGILAWVALRAKKNEFSSAYYTPVELGALYWHLVDLIWIFLFPLVYLVA